MRARLAALALASGSPLGCGGDNTQLTPISHSVDSSGGTEGGFAGGATAANGGTGAGDGNTDAGVLDAGPADGSTGDASPDGATDPGAPIRVNIDASSIVFFRLPIGSTRYAAAGFDPNTRVCASIIWSYSNNLLEVERHCDDFLIDRNFPYVVLETEREEPCPYLWDYGGLNPISASGCIDPVEHKVNMQVEVEVNGIRYDIQMTNDSSL